MSKHTPGPLKVNGQTIIVAATGNIVAEAAPENPELWEAYATLFAAAPTQETEHLRDMLDCQERIVNLLEALRAVVTGVEGVRYGEPIGHIRDIAVVAIQKEEKEGAPNE